MVGQPLQNSFRTSLTRSWPLDFRRLGNSRHQGVVAGIACAIGAIILSIMGIDILTFIMPTSSRPGMVGSSDPVKLGWMGALCVIAAMVHIANAWRIFQPASQQRSMAGSWSPLLILMWWGTGILGLLVYYPIPYFNHHVDRFLLLVVLMLGWGAWLLLSPVSLGWMLGSRGYSWARLLTVNVVIFFLLAECVMRLVDPVFARSGLFADTSNTPGGGIPHQLVPGSNMRTNSQGFRDRERPIQRTSSAPRVVAIGDSFTWGAGASYEETFTTLVEHGLNEISPGAEVINLGIIGYQPAEYLSLLRMHGLAYDPDLVLVNLYIGNDLMPAEGMVMIVAGQRHRVHVNGNWFHDHVSWDHWYLYHNLTHAYGMVVNWLREAREDAGSTSPAVPLTIRMEPKSSPALFSAWSRRYLRVIHGIGDQYLKHDTPAFLSRWRDTRETLDKLDALLREHGIPWILVLSPAEEQVDQELQRQYLEMVKGASQEYEFDKPQRLLREWSATQGVRLIDLAPAFRANVTQYRLYVNDDIHWNSNGHAMAAAVILREIQPDFARAR